MKSIIILLLSFCVMVIVGCKQKPQQLLKPMSAWDVDTARIDSAFRIKKEDVLCIYEEGKVCPCVVNKTTDTVITIEGVCIALRKGFKVDYIEPN